MSTKILIVEDDGTIVVRLERLLRGWGYETLAVESGESALRSAEAFRPDIALMDIRLSDDDGLPDGIETAQQLRDRFDIPSIYLTAYADDAFLQRARLTEPYGYLVKPLQELSLRTTLDMAVAKRRADRRLADTLAQNNALMKEILHRTKNNMASIISLLHLQSDRLNDARITQVFDEIESRVRALLLVQEKLYQSADFNTLDLKEYLEDLAASLFYNLQPPHGTATLHCELEPLNVSPDIAIPCGLIVNELLTNALKYAFPDGKHGKVTIYVHAIDGGLIELGVKNTGVPLPEDFNVRNLQSLGLELVLLFAEMQLKGSFHVRRHPCTEFLIRFPL